MRKGDDRTLAGGLPEEPHAETPSAETAIDATAAMRPAIVTRLVRSIASLIGGLVLVLEETPSGCAATADPRGMERMFRPASLVLGRLRFAQKFVVVALVLAVPLGVVAFAYSREQHSGVSTTAQERVGLASMEPLLALDEAVATARHAAITSGKAVPVRPATIAAVDSTQRTWAHSWELPAHGESCVSNS